MSNYWSIILAAGKSSRLKAQGIVNKKQFLSLQGIPLFLHSVLKFASIPQIKGVVVVFPPADFEEWQKKTLDWLAKKGLSLPVFFTRGGELRQDSVFNGLEKVPNEVEKVFVHDGARPFFSSFLVQKLIEYLEQNPFFSGVIPGVKSKDTLKVIEGNKVKETLDREKIFCIQTPQLFYLDILKQAHLQAREDNFVGTDDASLVERINKRVGIVEGEESNIKITTKEDLVRLKPRENIMFKTGFGYDVHAYGGDKPLILGGIPISEKIRVKAHSDGDVVFHALTDALLGALGEPDIGTFFPDTDSTYENMASSIFFKEALLLASQKNYKLAHIDLTIVAQVPKLSPFKEQIKKNLMGLTGLCGEDISIKATTEEGLGFTGNKKGIKAYALVTIKKEVKEDNDVYL